jgi:multidrug efflux pump subunit AcrA (membrane-fusion protein)
MVATGWNGRRDGKVGKFKFRVGTHRSNHRRLGRRPMYESFMSTKIDLNQLSIDRSDPKATAVHRARSPRRYVARYVVPIGIVVGFAILVAAAMGRRMLPVRDVSVVPVITKQSTSQREGQPLFQAPGWVEPRPTPMKVPALAPGILENLLVVEGQRIEAGEVIANLIPIDAELAVRRQRAKLAIRQGEYDRAVAELDAATLRVEKPVHLEVLLADAESELAASQSDLVRLPHLIRSAEAELTFARESVESKRAAGAGVSGVIRQRAEADLKDAQARLRELEQRQPSLEERTAALRRKVAALRAQLSLLIEEQGQLAEARAKVETAAALRDEAQVGLEEAELELARTQISAPRGGRVLQLVASPGDRVVGLRSAAESANSTIIQMYDPESLQVRVDVRLEDVPLVVPNQQVNIQTAATRELIRGRVLQPTTSANIQKNTLEVKVALDDPPATITPEMLVTATFLAPPPTGTAATSESTRQMFVPTELILDESAGARVWIVDDNQQAKKIEVEVGTASPDGLTQIIDGLQPTDKLIAGNTNDLQTGERVRVIGDDQRIGMRAK